MSRPLSRGPQFDDAAEAEPAVDRARPTERIDLAQVEAQAGATEAIAMPPGGEGWGYLPPSTSTPQLAASPDQRSQYTQVLQRARRVDDDGHAHANGRPHAGPTSAARLRQS